MNNPSNQELFDYYDERAPEFEAFYYGKFPTPHPDPDIYSKDRLPIQSLLPGYVGGRCIDIACGTGFWLPYYHHNCSLITLIDQSERMLAECSKKVHDLGIENKTSIVLDNIFSQIPPGHSYDSAVIGFLISHFTDAELARFFTMLKALLAPSGTFVIIDSLWSEEIKSWRRVKAGMNKRELFDGREFQIYKKFFEKKDLRDMAKTHSISLEIIYWGKLFFMATGRFNDQA